MGTREYRASRKFRSDGKIARDAGCCSRELVQDVRHDEHYYYFFCEAWSSCVSRPISIFLQTYLYITARTSAVLSSLRCPFLTPPSPRTLCLPPPPGSFVSSHS